MAKTTHTRFLSLGTSNSLKSLALVLSFALFTWLIIIRLEGDSITEIVSNKLRSDFYQLTQLQERASATQFNFIETLPMLLANDVSQPEAIKQQLQNDWTSLSLLNDVESFVLYNAQDEKFLELGKVNTGFQVSAEQLQEIRNSFIPQQRLFCDTQCHFYTIAPAMLHGNAQYVAVTSIPAELVIRELAWLSDVDVAIIDQHHKAIASTSEHTDLNFILMKLRSGTKQSLPKRPFFIGLGDTYINDNQGQHHLLQTVNTGNHYYSFATFPIETHSSTSRYQVVLARDITPAAHSAMQLIFRVGLLLLLGSFVSLLLSMATHRGFTQRIKSLSQALPSLASGHFDQAYAQLGKRQHKRRLVNELDQLEDTARTLTSQLDEMTHELLKQRTHLQTMAYQDSLTGLPNRQSFYDQLIREINGLSRTQDAVGLLFIDLDHFKQINDTYGHNAGDSILIGLSTRTIQCIRKTDHLFRLAGDEFVIIATHLQSPEGLKATADKILATFAKPLMIDDQAFTLSLSIGGTLTRDEHISVDQLLNLADEAMYASKHQGRGRYTFHGDIESTAEG